MNEIFKEIYSREKNETTAFVLMLGVLSEKLTDITVLLQDLKKLSIETLSCLQPTSKGSKIEIVMIEPLTPEDYMD